MAKGVIATVIVIVALVATGILEIKFHPENVRQIPARAISVVNDPRVRQPLMAAVGRAGQWAQSLVMKKTAEVVATPTPTEETPTSSPSPSATIPLQF